MVSELQARTVAQPERHDGEVRAERDGAVKCPYCGAANIADEHRCGRCGRRVRPATARPAPEAWVVQSSAAPAQAAQPPAAAVHIQKPPAPAQVRPKVVYQAPLFGPQVIPTAGAQQPKRAPQAPRALRAAPGPDRQQNLFAVHPTGAGRVLKTSVEASIYCDAPVATPTHRIIAASLDLALVMFGATVLLLVFRFAGGEIVLNTQTIAWYAAIPAALGVFYRLLWCMAGADSAGMRWTGLRLLNFDGQTPDRRHRLLRLAAGCLSLSAAGLGLIWALTDEEKLTWHDHISKTFPTAL